MHHGPAALRESGHKLTPQRLLIWHLLQAGGHLTIDDIRTGLEEHMYGVDQSTIYRTLDLLIRLQLVREIRLADGRCLYEVIAPYSHHHFVCCVCGTVSDFAGERIEGCIESALAGEDASVQRVDLTVTGVCARCRSRQAIVAQDRKKEA